MRYQAFEGFGVEVYKKGELVEVRYFDELKDTVDFSRDVASAMLGYRIVTVNKWGSVIDVLTATRSCI